MLRPQLGRRVGILLSPKSLRMPSIAASMRCASLAAETPHTGSDIEPALRVSCRAVRRVGAWALAGVPRQKNIGMHVSASGARARRPAEKSLILRSNPCDTRDCSPSQSCEYDFRRMCMMVWSVVRRLVVACPQPVRPDGLVSYYRNRHQPACIPRSIPASPRANTLLGKTTAGLIVIFMILLTAWLAVGQQITQEIVMKKNHARWRLRRGRAVRC